MQLCIVCLVTSLSLSYSNTLFLRIEASCEHTKYSRNEMLSHLFPAKVKPSCSCDLYNRDQKANFEYLIMYQQWIYHYNSIKRPPLFKDHYFVPSLNIHGTGLETPLPAQFHECNLCLAGNLTEHCCY